MTAPRSLAERTRDTRALLASTVDCWVATAHRGRPLLAPLSFLVADGRIWMATPVEGALARPCPQLPGCASAWATPVMSSWSMAMSIADLADPAST